MPFTLVPGETLYIGALDTRARLNSRRGRSRAEITSSHWQKLKTRRLRRTR